MDLRGPENDVALWAELLTSDLFGFEENNILTLAGWPSRPKKRPTRDNIAQGFQWLEARVGPGDAVVVLFAGQALNHEGTEYLLAADSRGLEVGDIGALGAISETELRAWLESLLIRDASVWFVHDACGAPDVEESSPRGDFRADTPARASEPGTVEPGLTTTETLLVLSASDATGMSSEEICHAYRGKVCGELSCTILKVLHPMSAGSQQLTFRNLADQIRVARHSEGRFRPGAPMIQGGGKDDVVYGLRPPYARSRSGVRLTTREDGNTLEIDVGTLHGVETGTTLACGLGGPDENPIGYVTVERLGLLTSVVVPAEFQDGQSRADQAFGTEARCRVVRIP